MSSSKRCIGILTSGGDCPGLNAVIRAVVKTSLRLDYDCVGFLRGYEGLIEPVSYMPLNRRNKAGILTQGVTFSARPTKGGFQRRWERVSGLPSIRRFWTRWPPPFASSISAD